MPSCLCHPFWIYLAVSTFLIVFVSGIDLMLGNRRIASLGNVPPAEGELPLISIVIAARNEEKNIEQALRSVLRLDYPRLEILVMEDRSTDGTGAVLDRLSARHPELRVVHLPSLPEGWIGKNHALWQGTRLARGEFLLLTDADVMMEPSTLRRAMAYVREKRLDHLALFPRVLAPTWLLDACIGSFTIFFNSYMKPWKARDPGSRCFIGIGAFNLVRRAAYEKVGGHQALRMRPDEDIKLGKLIKRAGFRQDLVSGVGQVAVEWYPSVPAFYHGLEKNMFAGVDYQLWAVALSSGLMFVLNIFPAIGALLGQGSVRWINGATVALYCLLYYDNARFTRVNRFFGILFPFGAVVYLGAFFNSTWQTLRHRGIYWRKTYYPLPLLKANRV